MSLALTAVFSVVLMGFAGWHWFLAIKGRTTIELCVVNDKTISERKRKRADFSRYNWRLNLEVIFGTKNLVEMLMPSTKKLPYDGINWPGRYFEDVSKIDV